MLRYDFERLRGTFLYGPGGRIDEDYRSGVWAEPIDRLLGARYSFAAETFADGCLFRGMRRGLRAAVEAGGFGPVDGDEELSLVEAVMGVSFVSHELRDALAVCRFGDDGGDAALLVIAASTFRKAQADGAAAVLAIGDSGMVFRYPFFAGSPGLEAAACVLSVDAAASMPRGWQGRGLRLPGVANEDLESAVLGLLANHGMAPARPASTEHWPHRPRSPA